MVMLLSWSAPSFWILCGAGRHERRVNRMGYRYDWVCKAVLSAEEEKLPLTIRPSQRSKLRGLA